ncbi:MAG: ABC transporter ATP-binding protein [Deltaproteobacteria bacterium]|nr:ABC transporter ATP-binding protein [Deltaproteobacteria bacterium]MBW2051368.1 ABC transporter ATP-binding protein [Deltaproteobacteria bacterium]MBW2139993.1 ABC transporter ATP-binding protein [Deltaproteobacteria bacterium]MBW2323959.1 ABC transporter ATP-binding protein [Deltaproteobacteria bacterium]
MDTSLKEPLIVTQGLTRIYNLGTTQVVGIQDIDLEIPSGELVVLKGESGSGKSTFLSLLAGLDHPTAGRLRAAGQNLHQATPDELNRYRREVVGMIFQSFNLLPTLTVVENVCLPALLAGRPYQEAKNQALKWLEWLNLEKRLHHYPTELSGGEMQRAAISRALINEPSIILADEPTGNLDSRNGRIVIELLSELNRSFNRTIIIATHSKLADSFATLQFYLKDGKITETIA